GTFNMAKGTSVKASATDSVGGSIDVSAGNDASIAGRIQARSGGLFDNEGYISVASGGNLTLAKGALLDVSASHPDLQCGKIRLADGPLDGPPPHLTIEQGAVVKANGHTAGFDSLDIDISGSICNIAGKIQSQAKSGNGAVVSAVCDSVTL